MSAVRALILREQPVPMAPPAPTAPAVRVHRKALRESLVELQAGAAELALASAKGSTAARAALQAAHAKIGAIEFEIGLNDLAYDLAVRRDIEAVEQWKAAVQALGDPDDIIAGITKTGCCGRCDPGATGCVITRADPRSGGSVCGHPITQRHLFHVDDNGRPLFPYRDTPQALRLYEAAGRALKVTP
jgi:hypothetical protein